MGNVSSHARSSREQDQSQVVWISGASSGLGRYTAQALAENGFTVIAGARSFGSGASIAGCHCLPLDVTDPVSMDGFVEQAEKLAGSPYALVNCPSIVVYGACETYDMDEIRRVMDTNFIGQASMISRALPLMREQGYGRIVNFSSINGLVGNPFEGAYVASKHALEGYSECLALETKPFGIEVMLVEPGAHNCSNPAYRCISVGMTEDSPYKDAFECGTEKIHNDGNAGADPVKFGQKVAKALKRKHLPRRLRVAKLNQRLAVIGHDLMPSWLFDRMLLSYYGKK